MCAQYSKHIVDSFWDTFHNHSFWSFYRNKMFKKLAQHLWTVSQEFLEQFYNYLSGTYNFDNFSGCSLGNIYVHVYGYTVWISLFSQLSIWINSLFNFLSHYHGNIQNGTRKQMSSMGSILKWLYNLYPTLWEVSWLSHTV